jgi:hypothetical protein
MVLTWVSPRFLIPNWGRFGSAFLDADIEALRPIAAGAEYYVVRPSKMYKWVVAPGLYFLFISTYDQPILI